MRLWGWCARARKEDVERELLAIAARRGLERIERATDGAVTLRILRAGLGSVVLGSEIAGASFARELSVSLAVSGRYAEVDLEDTRASASAHDIDKDGKLGAEEDLDELVTETCEGKEYLPAAQDHLVGICLGVAADPGSESTQLVFARTGSARVRVLLDAVAAGARWDKTAIGGRPAVRIVTQGASRISVLADDEMRAFDEGVARSLG